MVWNAIKNAGEGLYDAVFDRPGGPDERARQAREGFGSLGDLVQTGVAPMQGSPQIGRSDFRGGQQDAMGELGSLSDLLGRRARGEGLVSELIGRRSRDTSRRFNMSQAAAMGGSPLAARLASQNMGRSEVGIAGETALAGAQEAAGAAMGAGQLQNLRGQLATQGRGQDIGRDFQQGQLDLQAQDLRQRLGLGQAGINAGLVGSLLGVEPGPSLFDQGLGFASSYLAMKNRGGK